MVIKDIIDKLYNTNNASSEELLYLLNNLNEDDKNYLMNKAHEIRTKYYDNKVFIRGLIEISNYCIKNCTYCGIRAGNKNAQRYRLTKEDILKCADMGNELGYKTFVLQGGEDLNFNDDVMIDIIKALKEKYPDNAITLSIGERSYESYEKMYKAGADRYLLRHETANKKLYETLHPNQSFENRMKCLYDLKKIGYQIGAGFMVGLPNQTDEDLVLDLMFIKKLSPHMCGIGPFIPHKDTVLCSEKSGSVDKTITMLSLIRLLLPDVLLPSTTALASIDEYGREKGLKAGANVVMPNLSPYDVRAKYSLYDGKAFSGTEGAQNKKEIKEKIEEAGFVMELDRGDNVNWNRK